MRIGEIWKSKIDSGKVRIVDIETGTIMGRLDEPYDHYAQWIKYIVLERENSFEDGCTREQFIYVFEKVYE